MASSSIIIVTVKVLTVKTKNLFSPGILLFGVLGRTSETVLQMRLFW